MKLTTIFLLLPLIGSAQLSLTMRAGYNEIHKNPIIAPAVSYQAYGFGLASEMIVNTSRSAPASFGLKIRYQYKFIQVGYGRYYDLYSMDKYDSWRNEWVSMYFVSLHCRKWFIEYDYPGIYTIGIKEPLTYKKKKK